MGCGKVERDKLTGRGEFSVAFLVQTSYVDAPSWRSPSILTPHFIRKVNWGEAVGRMTLALASLKKSMAVHCAVKEPGPTGAA